MQVIKTWRFIVLYILLGLAALYVYTRSEAAVPVNKPLSLFPQQVGGWTMTGQARFDERVLAVLLPTDYLSRSYQGQGRDQVSLYIGYHDGGPNSGPIHSPKQCLPGSGWNRLNGEARQLVVNGEEMSYVSSLYQKDSQQQLFLYWFQVQDQFLTNEYALKLAMAKNSFLSNRRDSSFIRLSVMVKDGEDEARLIGEDFIKSFLPAIQESLPR
ncbi:EpsI family protein [Desulfuromusa kysingii]|uniref:EpsI family protein n=1 Tax=Desulfuromusa kysingii TaxID=37625 RepID=A0A1H4BB00_9BACT|nr:exosortase C-terminal domain/associated protein EpsI [Desulfuromusa kysingii]SEA45323.1 EpsI family protein [Desulfuromusa kysingii]